jgi:3-methyladenine DNA glycosylase/8-oxoguanine DNA glycosylase
VLARTLGRPRLVAGDLGVRKAVGLAYRRPAPPSAAERGWSAAERGHPAPSETEVRAMAAHWGQSSGVAQAVLLQALGEGALSAPKPAQPVSRAVSRR